MDINPQQLVHLKEYNNLYSLTHYGKLCYFNKITGKWMFCKKADKPGFVIIWHNGKQLNVNQTQLADKYSPNWRKLAKLYNEATKVLKTPQNRDGRYKEGRDTGRFGSDR